jgi:hypothetical protein
MNPVVSAVLIIAFSISILTLVLNFGLPILDEKKAEIEFQRGKNIVNSLSVEISNLLSKPVNSSIEKEIEFYAGILEFSNSTISFSTTFDTYNRTFQNIQFTNLTIFSGKTKLKLIKKSRNFIEVEEVQ